MDFEYYVISQLLHSVNSSGINLNFTCLDSFLRNLEQNDLLPLFEIMGNPSNYFRDLENHTEIVLWSELVHQLASRYIG